MDTDTKRELREELIAKIGKAVMGFVEEHNHQRAITISELSDLICKADSRFTEQDVLLALQQMPQIKEYIPILDRIILNR